MSACDTVWVIWSADGVRKAAGDYSVTAGKDLRGRLTDRNPPDDPERISPRDVTRDFLASPSLRPYSYTVVEFNLPGTASGSDRK